MPEDSDAQAKQESRVPANSSDDEGISLLDLAVILAKHKRKLIILPALVAALAIAYALYLPNVYTASTKIMPPQQSQSAAATMLSQMGALGGAVGGATGIKNPNDLYVGMLKSRTVADAMIGRFGLMKLFETEVLSAARSRLMRASNIAAARDGFITIEVEDIDPQRAADLANGYVDELLKMTKVLAVTEASQRRMFYEKRLAQAREDLSKQEDAARNALEKGGVIKVDDQGRSTVENSARLRAQITAKEVQIGAMRAFATDNNPDLRLAQKEVESLRIELAKLEGTRGAPSVLFASGGKGIDNLRLLRDLKYSETLYELMARQYEIAKIDEAKDAAIIQVVDKAIPPDRKSKPQRSAIVIISGAVALAIAMLWAFLAEAAERAYADPEKAKRLAALRGYLRYGK